MWASLSNNNRQLDSIWDGRNILIELDRDYCDKSADDDSEKNSNSDCAAEAEDCDPLVDCHYVAKRAFFEAFGFSRLTPIQKAVIPLILKNSTMPTHTFYTGDLIITAPTGQGKTLCYALPIMSSLFYSMIFGIFALVIAPTRELVNQIASVFSTFCDFSKKICGKTLSSICILASLKSFQMEQNELKHSSLFSDDPFENVFKCPALTSKIVIATPGRFVEHLYSQSSSTITCLLKNAVSKDALNSNNFLYQQRFRPWAYLQWIVEDEVDRLLDQPYQGWIKELNCMAAQCARRPHRIIAAATMTCNPEKLHMLQLERPLTFGVSEKKNCYTVPTRLQQKWVLCPSVSHAMDSVQIKPLILLYLLHQLYTVKDTKTWRRSPKKKIKTIIFCSCKSVVTQVTQMINLHFREPFHDKFPPAVTLINLKAKEQALGDQPQEVLGAKLPFLLSAKEFTADLSHHERVKLLHRFKHISSDLEILVCTDVFSRGLDVKSLNVVINYDCPSNFRAYLHRIGRTARAGKPGLAFSLVTALELPSFKRLLKENILPEGKHEGEPYSFWDIVHKHPIPVEHLLPWITPRLACQDECELVESHNSGISTTSYYAVLLGKLALLDSSRHT